MCGIAGLLSTKFCPGGLDVAAARMASALRDRGPDDEGVWADPEAGVAFGHRRLAVIDLTTHGHQPMTSSCGRYVLAFNGEIYNFQDLRAELETLGHRFRGYSDTEVMLASFSQWGIEDSIPRLDGMFAFSAWDRSERALHLARDRAGEKPLYYGWTTSALVFGSDLRAIEQHPDFAAAISSAALSRYLRYGYVPAPFSIYEGIFKLPAGCRIRFGIQAASRPGDFDFDPGSSEPATGGLRPVRYWSAAKVASHGLAHPFGGTERNAVDRLGGLLRDSVRRRMIADVPIGALLSGGIDSSLVVALMQEQSDRPVRTFTIGFDEKAFDEAADARAIASHLGTDHTELRLRPQQALDVIARLPLIYDEPFADASQIPATLLCGLVRQHVTVALSGDGGDELFGGYRRYALGTSVWGRVRHVPLALRSLAARGLMHPTADQWEAVARFLPFLPKAYGGRGTGGDRIHKVADVLAMPDSDALYERLMTIGWHDAAPLLGAAAVRPDRQRAGNLATGDVAVRMMLMDLIGYLPDDILTKVDRASMSASLEVRVPLLDHRIIEFAWSLPARMKIRGGESKHVLRMLAHRHIPAALLAKPKRGFGIPLGAWLRGPLRDWAGSLIFSEADCGPLDMTDVRQKWQEHLAGKRNWENQLWLVLMFQAWHQSRGRSVPSAA